MAPKSQKSKSINKADPRRPYIILRTLPSFSFSTPSQSVGVHFSLHVSPTPQDKLRLMAVPLVPSARMFGPGQRLGSPTPSDMGRALANRTPRSLSPHSSTSSTNDRISTLESRVSTLERKLDNIEHELKELKEDVQELKEDVQELKEDVQELKEDVQELKTSIDKKMDQFLATVDKKMDQFLATVLERLAEKERSLIASAPPVPAQLDTVSGPTRRTSPIASRVSPTANPAPASPASPTPTPMTPTADAAAPHPHETASAVDLPRASDSRGGVFVRRVRRIASRVYRTARAFHRGAGRSAAVKAKGGREEKTKAAPSTPRVL